MTNTQPFQQSLKLSPSKVQSGLRVWRLSLGNYISVIIQWMNCLPKQELIVFRARLQNLETLQCISHYSNVKSIGIKKQKKKSDLYLRIKKKNWIQDIQMLGSSAIFKAALINIFTELNKMCSQNYRKTWSKWVSRQGISMYKWKLLKKKRSKMDILTLKSYHQNEKLTRWTQYQIPDGKQKSGNRWSDK